MPVSPTTGWPAASASSSVPRMSTTDAVVPPEQLALGDATRTAVQNYLDERRMITVRLVLGPPAYLPVSVRVEVYARPRTNKGQTQAAVEKALYRFIHPTVGGPEGNGWPFERALFHSDIYGLLQGVTNVEHLGSVEFVSFDADGAEHPVGGDTLALPANTLPCSAQHQVTMK